jgi:hypothetical protein
MTINGAVLTSANENSSEGADITSANIAQVQEILDDVFDNPPNLSTLLNITP